MAQTAPTTSNAEQIEFWNGDAGVIWARQQARMDELLAPITATVLEACGVRPGERVLDVGCGCGDTAIALAQRGARLTAVDVSQPMLACARERAHAAGLDIEFVQADAAEARFDEPYDAMISRFGVMFFADPTLAFTNLCSALKRRGRLCFVCWQAPQLNPWISVPIGAVRSLLPPPPETDPRAPGPFAFADCQYLDSILTGAGFGDVRIDPLETALSLGADVAEAVEMVCKVGPLSRAVAILDPAARAPVFAAVSETLAAHATPTGVALGAACWLVRGSC